MMTIFDHDDNFCTFSDLAIASSAHCWACSLVSSCSKNLQVTVAEASGPLSHKLVHNVLLAHVVAGVGVVLADDGLVGAHGAC